MIHLRRIFLIVALMGALHTLNAQVWQKDDKVLNFGLGVGNTLYSGSYYTTTLPPISVSYEQGIVDEVLEKGSIGVGGYLGYAAYKWEFTDWGWKYSNLIIGARGSFHYPFLDQLDTYGGLMLAYNSVTSREFGNTIPGYQYSVTNSGLLLSLYIGGRYYIKDNFAIMAELGYGIAILNLGVALKL